MVQFQFPMTKPCDRGGGDKWRTSFYATYSWFRLPHEFYVAIYISLPGKSGIEIKPLRPMDISNVRHVNTNSASILCHQKAMILIKIGGHSLMCGENSSVAWLKLGFAIPTKFLIEVLPIRLWNIASHNALFILYLLFIYDRFRQFRCTRLRLTFIYNPNYPGWILDSRKNNTCWEVMDVG